MTRRLAPFALATAALLMPLLWSPFFSDFDGAKSLLLLAVVACSLPYILIRACRINFGSGAFLAVMLLLPLLVVSNMQSTTLVLSGLVVLALVLRPANEKRRFLLCGMVGLSTAVTLLLGVLQEHGALGSWLPYRPGSFAITLGNAGHVAEFGVAALPMVWFFCTRYRWYWSLLFSMPAVALIIRSDSRAGLLALLVTATVWLALQRWAPQRPAQTTPRLLRTMAAFSVLLAACALLGAPQQSTPHPLERLSTVVESQHPTNQVRLDLWSSAWLMIKDAPLKGSREGFGNLYPKTRGAREWDLSGFDSVVAHPHNEYLRILVKSGVLGSLLIVVVLFFLVFLPARSSWLSGENEVRDSLIAALAQVGGIGVMALFWAPFRQPTICFLLALGAGLAIGTAQIRERKEHAGLAYLFLPCCVVILAAMLVAHEGKGSPLILWRDVQFVLQRDRLEDAKREWVSLRQEEETHSKADEHLRSEVASATELLNDVKLPATAAYRLLLALTDIRKTAISLAASPNIPQDEKVSLHSILPAQDLRRAFHWARYLSKSHHVNTLLLNASFESVEGRDAEATMILEGLIEVNPSTPRVRTRLAAMAGEAGLPDRAIRLLEDELSIYGESERSNDTWELLARTTGWSRKIEEAQEIISRWIAQLGDSRHRREVGGSINLHIGETPSTVGAFLRDPEPFEDRVDRGTFFAASLAGLPPKEQHARCLAHLFKHPHDGAALDALGAAIAAELLDARGETAKFLRSERYRALARAKTLHAWDDHEDGEDDRAMIFLSLAARANPSNHDVHFLRIIIHLDSNRPAKALAALVAWRGTGNSNFDALNSHPITRSFRETADVRAIIGN